MYGGNDCIDPLVLNLYHYVVISGKLLVATEQEVRQGRTEGEAAGLQSLSKPPKTEI
jgi:hypothetical protein